MGSQVLSSSSNNISRLHGDNSTIGVSDEASVGETIHTNRVDSTSSSSVGNLGSVDIRSISRDHSTISMSHQTMWVAQSIGERVGSDT